MKNNNVVDNDDINYLSFLFPPLWQNYYIGSSDFSPNNNDAWERVLEDCLRPVVLYYMPLLLSSYGLSVLVLKRFTDWKGLKLQKLAGQLSMYPAFLVLICTSHGTILQSQFWTSGYEERKYGSSDLCDLFANFYIAANIVQAMGQIQTEKAPLLYQLMGHHILSVGCYVCGFYFNRFRWWTAFAGASEFTNLFLVPVFACKEYFPEWRKEYWYLWSTRLLWLSFITHRFLLFPSWLVLWMYDRWKDATSSGREGIHWIEGILYPTTIFALVILSMVWFKIIDRGLKKQLISYTEAQKKKN